MQSLTNAVNDCRERHLQGYFIVALKDSWEPKMYRVYHKLANVTYIGANTFWPCDEIQEGRGVIVI